MRLKLLTSKPVIGQFINLEYEDGTPYMPGEVVSLTLRGRILEAEIRSRVDGTSHLIGWPIPPEEHPLWEHYKAALECVGLEHTEANFSLYIMGVWVERGNLKT